MTKPKWPTNGDRELWGVEVWEAFAAMFPRNDPDGINVQQLLDALDTCAECGEHRDRDSEYNKCTCGTELPMV